MTKMDHYDLSSMLAGLVSLFALENDFRYSDNI